MELVRLRHLHLPCSPAKGTYPSYKTAAAIQELLRRRLLDFKDSQATHNHGPHTTPPPRPYPPPTLISFTPQPTYTLGRRQNHASHASALSPSDIARLKAPLTIINNKQTFHPAVLTSPRGGLATYHGPGQIVLWPIMAIAASGGAQQQQLGYKSFTVRCYSRLLEKTTIAVLRRLFDPLQGLTTDDPGVWVAGGNQPAEVRKIAALGIHLRRHVSGLGAALNLDMPTTMEGEEIVGEARNPWARFTACGLEGKRVTCVREELTTSWGKTVTPEMLNGEVVARAWAEELAEEMGLGRKAVETVGNDELDELMASVESQGYLDMVGKDEI